MHEKHPKTPLTIAVGAAITAAFAVAPAAQAANPFVLTGLASAYMAAGEGSCGGSKKDAEGKCGGEKGKEGACGGEKGKEGSCGGEKGKEGTCGGEKGQEGKCGGDKEKDKEGAGSAEKKPGA